MILLIAAATAALAPAQPALRAVPASQARATVRIVSAVRLRAGATQTEDGRLVKQATIRGEGGSRQPAMLVEFE
jgi:hypothetical protein